MARREYARIGTDMPDESSIRALSVGAQWLYDRLLLSPELSRCGVLPLRVALWSDRAPDASERKVRDWLKELTKSRHVAVDERYQEVLVRTYVRHDGLLGQPNVVAAMVGDFALIASPTVRLAYLAEFRRLWDLDLSEGERGGWCLAVGHFPERKGGKDDHHSWPAVLPGDSLARLSKSIGTGLRDPLTEVLGGPQVSAFDEDSPRGIPEPFTRTLPRTPSCGRDRGERLVPAPTPSPGPSAQPRPTPSPSPPEPTAATAPEVTSEGETSPAESVRAARKRAGLTLTGWTDKACATAVQATSELTDPDTAWQALTLVAAQPETTAPGRLVHRLDDALAELRRMRVDQGNQRAEREHQAREAHEQQQAADRAAARRARFEALPDHGQSLLDRAELDLREHGAPTSARAILAAALDLMDAKEPACTT